MCEFSLQLPEVPQNPAALDAWVQAKENSQSGIKEDNQARIVWHNPTQPQRSKYAMVYLHGLTASQGDGAPQHRRLAQAFGCNLFLARLPGHGLVTDSAMQGLTTQQILETTVEALAIGQVIGKKIILIGTSLGASLAIWLAARPFDVIMAIIAWSPGIRAYNEQALHELCHRRDEIFHDTRPRSGAHSRYWSSSVHSDAYRSLSEFFRAAMIPVTFAKVQVPFFLAYYYADEQQQDQIASVSAMLTMYEQLGTAHHLKRKESFANGAHSIASPERSAAAEQVYQASRDFLEQVIGLTPI